MIIDTANVQFLIIFNLTSTFRKSVFEKHSKSLEGIQWNEGKYVQKSKDRILDILRATK